MREREREQENERQRDRTRKKEGNETKKRDREKREKERKRRGGERMRGRNERTFVLNMRRLRVRQPGHVRMSAATDAPTAAPPNAQQAAARSISTLR